ncbi:MAG: glutamate racemase [Nitrospinae bacterium]|nr:glutamate racemase [Nitrospinota bacterium]
MTDRRPIGVFDSGIGGLTVVKAIRDRLPNESILYLGDTARVPYGTKSKETVVRYSVNAAEALLSRGVKMLVIACNTASASALPEVIDHAGGVPVIGVVEGGVAAALKATDGRVGVIGTESTVRSGAYEKGIDAGRKGITVVSRPCPLFVGLAEEGWSDNEVALATAHRYLDGLTGQIDTLVLGCTHYPVLKPVIAKVMGPGVKLIDSGEETAQVVERRLAEYGLATTADRAGRVECLVTDSPERSLALARRLLGAEVAIDSCSLIDISPFAG